MSLEESIALIYQKLLNIPKVSTTTSFFDLGGDSLLAMNLQIELMQISNNITYADIFMYPTVKGLANKINKNIKLARQSEENNDYSDFDKILKNNNIIKNNPNKIDCGSILLTGATGFLGIHILKELLIHSKEDIMRHHLNG